MKPPPRKRTKPDRNFRPYSVPQGSGNQVPKKWCRAEQNKLLNGLRRLRRTGGDREIDYAFLTKYVPSRSVSEVQSMVELLKHKVASCVSYKLKRARWEEEKGRNPIEEWTHMASVVAGTLEEPISAAFSQMLIVSSTEPRTLRNGDPPQIHTLPTDKDSRTVPWRPMPRLAVQGEPPSTNTAQSLQGSKSPGPVFRMPILKIPPAQQQLSTTARTSLGAGAISPSSVTVTPRARQARTSSSPAAVVKTQITISTKSTLSRPPTALSCSATGPTTVPSATPSSVASSNSATSHSSSSQSTPSLSTKDSPRMSSVKHVVDFEKIYRYLSCIHKPNKGCCLTPMESAIVLDLLMSLPEELPLLDCNRLHQHLIQVYHSFSSPANSKIARELFKEMKAELGARTETTSGPASDGANGQQDTAETADNSDVAHSGGKKIQPDEAESQSSANTSASSQAKGAGVTPPPLNPFMIPLKLLKRK